MHPEQEAIANELSRQKQEATLQAIHDKIARLEESQELILESLTGGSSVAATATELKTFTPEPDPAVLALTARVESLLAMLSTRPPAIAFATNTPAPAEVKDAEAATGVTTQPAGSDAGAQSEAKPAEGVPESTAETSSDPAKPEPAKPAGRPIGAK